MERVINEFKVIETDDGFRIEIKGDKEAIRPHDCFRAGGPFGRGFRFGFGPGFWGGFGGWWDPRGETEEEKKRSEV